MDTPAALKSDSIRNAFTLLVPGGTAIAPWLCVALHLERTLLDFADSHGVLSGLVLLFGTLATGKVIDDLGTYWETGVNDAILAKNQEFPRFEEDWYEYLRSTFPPSTVAAGYISDMVVALKFEINQAIALILLWLGCIPLAYLRTGFNAWHVVIVAIVSTAFAGVFLYNAYCSSRVLARVRRELRKGVIVLENQDLGSRAS